MRIIYHHRTRATDAQRIHIVEIIRAFRALGHEVREVSLVSSETEMENAERDAGEAGWKKLVKKIPGAYDLVQIAYNAYGLPKLIAEIRRFQPDFLYERHSLWNFAGVLAARWTKIPMTLEVNSPFSVEHARDGDTSMVRLAAWSERKVCNLASRVIVVSTPLKRLLAASGVDESRIVVMTNGVDPEAFRAGAPDAQLKEKLGLSGRTVIGFVGWFRNWHRIDLLIEAFHRGGLSRRQGSLLLIGDGPAMPELKNQVTRLGLGSSVVFTGPLPHSRTPAYLNLVDIAVQPAANEYCCPMKILEYIGMGKPVVAPRQENIVEIVTDGQEALLFEPDDADSMAGALVRLVSDADLRARMGQTAGECIARRGYLWSANARRVVDMMRESRGA